MTHRNKMRAQNVCTRLRIKGPSLGRATAQRIVAQHFQIMKDCLQRGLLKSGSGKTDLEYTKQYQIRKTDDFIIQTTV